MLAHVWLSWVHVGALWVIIRSRMCLARCCGGWNDLFGYGEVLIAWGAALGAGVSEVSESACDVEM